MMAFASAPISIARTTFMLASSISIQALPAIPKHLAQTSSSSDQFHLLNALGLKGIDAITCFRQCQQASSRPMIEALLRRLPVAGMNT